MMENFLAGKNYSSLRNDLYLSQKTAPFFTYVEESGLKIDIFRIQVF